MNGNQRHLSPRLVRGIRLFAVYGALPALTLFLCAILFFFQVTDGTLLRLGSEVSLGEGMEVLSLALNVRAADEVGQESEPMLPPEAVDSVLSGIAFVGELPEGVHRVLEVTIENSAGLINATENQVNAEEMYGAAYPYTASSVAEEGPAVLVYHTHATESYFEKSASPIGFVADEAANVFGYYAYDADTRSYDNQKNVVEVGRVFCARLEELGVKTVHSETQHDAADYSQAYNRSLETVESYLAEYPSIRYIIDLHRDSLLKENGDKLKPSATVGGEKCAQVMLVVGCGGTNAAQPNWRQNLALNYRWQSYLRAVDESFARPMYLRYGRFNQQTSVGAMLLEVGTCGNTLEEACRSGQYAADALAAMIRENE